jgi:hypothetical protein
LMFRSSMLRKRLPDEKHARRRLTTTGALSSDRRAWWGAPGTGAEVAPGACPAPTPTPPGAL